MRVNANARERKTTVKNKVMRGIGAAIATIVVALAALGVLLIVTTPRTADNVDADTEEVDTGAVDMAVEAAMREHWTDDFDSAKAQAAQEGKCLLVYVCDFYDDARTFVMWSRELEAEVFTNEEFLNAAEKDYVLVKIAVPRKEANLSEKTRKQNEELVEKYRARFFLPIVMVLDAEGEELGKTTSAAYHDDGPLKYLERNIAAKKAAGLECRKYKESIGALEKGSPERLAKIDELFQKIGEREVNSRRDLYDFAKELLENDSDGKFAEKYPFFAYAYPALEKEYALHIMFHDAATDEKEAAISVLEKIPETRKAIEDIKSSAPKSVHMLINRTLADLDEFEEKMKVKAAVATHSRIW